MIYSPLAPGRLFDLAELLRNQHPGRRIATVTPSDTEDLPFIPTVLYFSDSGRVRVRLADGSESEIVVTAGANQAPAEIVRILATGTTANLVAVAG